MQSRTKQKAKIRPPLSRERAVDVAVALADAEGLARLTMRRLAKQLGVEAMSLYPHVPNKEDILDGMVDRVFAEIALPPADVDWKTAIRRRSRSALEVLEGHPWAISLMDSRS